MILLEMLYQQLPNSMLLPAIVWPLRTIRAFSRLDPESEVGVQHGFCVLSKQLVVTTSSHLSLSGQLRR